MKLHVLNTSQGLIPLYDDDYEEKRKLKIGEKYSVEIKKARNVQFHRLYFALINCAWEYLNEAQSEFFHNNKTVFRKSLEVSAGHCDKVFSFKLKDWVDIPKSISFDKMSEFEFRELYERVKDVIFNTILRTITVEEFESNLINF